MRSIENKPNLYPPQKQAQQNNLPKFLLGITAGAATGFTVNKVSEFPVNFYKKVFFKQVDKITPQQKASFVDEVDRMIKESGIEKKGFRGIKLIDANNKEAIDKVLEQANKETKEVFKNGSFSNKLNLYLTKITKPFQSIANYLIGKFPKNNFVEGVKFGGFNFITNSGVAGESTSLFHEVGHAINSNKNFISKIPSRLKLIATTTLIPFVIINAMLTKKPQGIEQKDKKKSFINKIKDFSRNHVGLTIVSLSMPLLTEEGIASIRAIKFVNASKKITEATKKQHNKLFQMAFCTYLIGTAVLASATELSVFAKDKITGYKSKIK